MAWVMSVLGAVLALGGGYALWNGSGYIRLDWGQAETVAGTVALSSGILTVAVAAVLFALRDLARAPARLPASGVGLEAVALDDEVAVPPPPARGGFRSRLATVGVPKAERIEPATLPSASGRDLDEPFTDSHALGAPAPEAAAPAYDTRPPSQSEAARPAVAPVAEAPTVVGRYEANGASYVLFSDGTIEVETGNGTHRFESMAHLKDHIERQDAG